MEASVLERKLEHKQNFFLHLLILRCFQLKVIFILQWYILSLFK